METFAEHYESMRRTILKCMPGAEMEDVYKRQISNWWRLLDSNQ